MDTALAGILNRHIPVRLDALFKLTSKVVVYQLADMTLLYCVGGTELQGIELMLRIVFTTHRASVVIPIAIIERIGHLILSKLE